MTTLNAPPASPPDRPWPPEQGQWTYEDWLRLPDDGFRYEVLNGDLFMAPPPTIPHQYASGSLFALMWLHSRQHQLGVVLEAPTGVRLPGQPVPVQPDILFVRRERQDIIGNEYVEGAPDLVVEILSPSNWLLDRKQKFQAYREAGVNEYWIVDYRKKVIEVYVLEEGTYALVGQHGSGEIARSTVLTGFEVKVEEVFAS
ncbi:MAG: Uma2 family endonuclease [Anaerolineales bacterium]